MFELHFLFQLVYDNRQFATRTKHHIDILYIFRKIYPIPFSHHCNCFSYFLQHKSFAQMLRADVESVSVKKLEICAVYDIQYPNMLSPNDFSLSFRVEDQRFPN